MPSPQTATQLREFVMTNFYIPAGTPLDDTTSFLEQGILDSTGVLELVTFLETKFGIEVQDEEMLPENLDSIRAISHYVARKLESRKVQLVA